MYTLNWNPDSQRLEASFGGVVTAGEGQVFLEDLREALESENGSPFAFVLDFATVRSLARGVEDAFSEARDMAKFSGAKEVVFVARDEDEVQRLTEQRLQQVIEGQERYVAYRLAS